MSEEIRNEDTSQQDTPLDEWGFPPFAPGERNDKGQLCAKPPREVATILKRFSASTQLALTEDARLIRVDGISEEDIKILNSFAASVAGVQECKVRAVHGCYSCFLGCRPMKGEVRCRYGNLVETDCGEQCWFCATD